MSTMGNHGWRPRAHCPASKQSIAARLSILVGAGALLAACGTTDAAGGTSGDVGDPLGTKDHPEVGRILVDTTGKALYFSDQEANGKIQCVAECLSFWFPAVAEDGTPTVAGVEDISVVHRTDSGQDQLTYQGKPLYTFKLDKSADDVAGNNAEDAFGGTSFTWHVAVVAGSGAKAPPVTNSDPYGGAGGY